ncbi:UDP-2,4-diacetamido-2,4,6-trideoxy-beta-L-altropyranose hydrolase [Clostridium sp. HMP27]|uniref:UDP-2,4-diacetamido-2,4, 6-trideoxy-beta-L-altropyranose hydrolase n=1 Tax=Clostridium sp. HMP27 TaxID=1487921 RepID=UPI00052B70E0|nr:UDP-2,4-diacetamido-2,4,6-trideoxy-beta-L-altropyranose hydrolase [Clostridium sp. HMP27]KGK86067.1 glycosyl transferase [Clostridium sp. HMP27]
MNICIRADGGSTIGMGHIMRTLVIARELKKNHNVFYACRVDNPLSDKYALGINKVKSDGFKVISLDEKTLKSEIRNIKADCIITDSYDVDEEYFNIIKQNFKISGCLDDERICNYFNVDFLINQNIYARNFDYKVNLDTELMLGNKYIILRDEFRNLKKKEIKKNVKNIMVTVGGSDNNNYTENIIKSLKKLTNVILYVIVGPAFNHIENLKQYESYNVKLCFNADMAKIMKECDLAIASCGTTLYELAAAGTPTIGIVVAENQVLAAETMDFKGIIKSSNLENLYNDIINLTYKERKKMSYKGRDIVDGMGVDRIVEFIEGRL